MLTGPLWSQNLKIEAEISMLALGDSYTIGESVSETERWPMQFVELLEEEGITVERLDIIARTGWTTRNLKDAIQSSYDPSVNYNLVSLLIGVNNQYQRRDINEYGPQFRELLEKALSIAGGDTHRVVVLSIPDYAYTPFGNGNSSISNEIDAYNAINRSITAEYKIPYVNVTDISRRGLDNPELVADDGLHPSGTQYKAWVAEIMNIVTFINTGTNQSIYRDSDNLFPNPVGDYLILPEQYRGLRAAIYDLHGRKVKAFPTNNASSGVALEFLASGIYVLLLYDDKKRYAFKFAKK